jgi:hypothetical protein
MKTAFSPSIDRYLARFTIFLVMVALVAGMVGCDGGWDLRFSGTTGGTVTATRNGEEPLITQRRTETMFGILAGTVVNLTATPDDGYRFVEWQGDVGTIANVKAANTTITMNSDYTITAWFVWGQEIRTWEDLDDIRNSLAGNHTLMNDLVSGTLDWELLASPRANNGTGWKPIVAFTGVFDGEGHEIRELSINRTTENYVGLFGEVRGGRVQNVTLVNANVIGEKYVGGLVGKNSGTVSSSTSGGTVTGSNEYVGGLVGWNEGTKATVSDSYSRGNVTGNMYVGGLVGWNEGKVKGSYFAGSVNGSNEYVGGLVAWNGDTVSSSSSSGTVTGSNTYVGGLVGWNDKDCEVKDSYSSSNVTGWDEHVGGLVGWNEGTVSSSNSTGSVKGTKDYVGGLVG